MKITEHGENKLAQIMPKRPYLARHKTNQGPLALITENGGFFVLFLEGEGGTRIYDQWGSLSRDEVLKNFIPVTRAFTFENEWHQ